MHLASGFFANPPIATLDDAYGGLNKGFMQ
jgi:hypothetical protein